MIFGGEAFVDLIGEISLMKDLTATMDITMQEMEEEELARSAEEKLNIHDDEVKAAAGESASTSAAHEATAGASAAAAAAGPSEKATSAQSAGTSTPRRNFGQQALMDKSEEEARMEAAGTPQRLRRRAQKGP
jgi:hypothetical protein